MSRTKNTFTLKRPRFLGLKAQTIGENATIGKTHHRAEIARAAIAKAYMNQSIHLLRNKAGRLFVFTEAEIPDLKSMGMTYDTKALIVWAGDDGAITLQKTKN